MTMSGMHEVLLLKYFGLQPPITLQQLKEEFRKKCKELHPDINPNADPHMFVKMKQAYDELVEDASLYSSSDIGNLKQKTVDGVYFTALGLGLRDPLKNATTCEKCNGLGRTSTKNHVLCRNCDGRGWGYTFKCPDCLGTGRFFQPRAKRDVTCRRCNGTGYLRFQNAHRCLTCHGTCFVEDETVWHFCYHCQGTGEIEIFNPVLPKNLILSSL
jgi:DnaJ-class molecular chaperone